MVTNNSLNKFNSQRIDHTYLDTTGKENQKKANYHNNMSDN